MQIPLLTNLEYLISEILHDDLDTLLRRVFFIF